MAAAPVTPPDDLQGAIGVFDWIVKWGYALFSAVVGGLAALVYAAWKAARSFSQIQNDTDRIERKVDAAEARIGAAEQRVQNFETEWREEVRRLGDKVDANHRQLVNILTVGKASD